MGNMQWYIVTVEGCPFLEMQFSKLNDDDDDVHLIDLQRLDLEK